MFGRRKRKKDVKDVSCSVRQVDVFHFHGLPCFLVRVEYASHSISKSSFYIANIAEKVANSFK